MPSKREAKRRHAAHYLDVLGKADKLFQDGRELSVVQALSEFDDNWRQIQQGQRWATDESQNDPEFRAMVMNYANISTYIADFRQERNERIVWLEAGLAASRQSQLPEMERALSINLGAVWGDLGQHRRAINHYEHALKLANQTGDQGSKAAAFGQLGNAYHSLGEYTKAIDNLERALALARQAQDRQAEVGRLNNLGSVYTTLSEYEKAIKCFGDALALAQEMDNYYLETLCLNNMGKSHLSVEKFEEALPYIERSLNRQQTLGDRQGQSLTLSSLGLIYQRLKHYDRALKCYREGLSISRKINFPLGEAVHLSRLGGVYFELHEDQQAVDHLEQSAVISRRIGDREREAEALTNLAQARLALKQDFQAFQALQHARELFQAINLPDRIADLDKLNRSLLLLDRLADTATSEEQRQFFALFSQGYHLLGQHEYESARAMFEHALEIATALQDTECREKALSMLGAVHSELGQLDVAAGYLKQLLGGSQDSHAEALSGLGAIATVQKDYPQALAYLEEALALTQKLGDSVREQEVLQKLARLYSQLKDHPKALQAFHGAIAATRNSGDWKNELKWLRSLGERYVAAKDDEQAIAAYERALAIVEKAGSREQEADIRTRLTDLYVRGRFYDKALASYTQSIDRMREIGDLDEEGRLLFQLGGVYGLLGQFDQEIASYERALPVVRQTGDRRSEEKIIGNLGVAHMSLHRYEQATGFFETAVQIAEEIGDPKDKVLWLNNSGQLYNDLGQDEKAITYFERALAVAEAQGDTMNEGLLLGNLGVCYSNLGQFQRAISYHRRAIPLVQSLGDAERVRLLEDMIRNCEISEAQGLSMGNAPGRQEYSRASRLLATWINIPDLEAAKLFLTEHADALLSDDMYRQIEDMVTRQADDKNLDRHCTLLGLCRKRGIDQAYGLYSGLCRAQDALQRLPEWIHSPKVQEWIEMVNTWVGMTDKEASRRYILEHQDVFLMPEIYVLVNSIGKIAQNKAAYNKAAYDNHETLLKECYAQGIEAAYRETEMLSWHPLMAMLVVQWLNSPLEAFLRQYQDQLLTNEGEITIKLLQRSTGPVMDPFVTLIQRARTCGVDAALAQFHQDGY